MGLPYPIVGPSCPDLSRCLAQSLQTPSRMLLSAAAMAQARSLVAVEGTNRVHACYTE